MLLAVISITPEEELPVQIGDVDGVHVNHIYVSKATQCQILQKLTAQASSSDAQDSYIVSEKWSKIFRRFEARPCDICRSRQQAVQIFPPICLFHLQLFL